ncbi:MAG: DNA polymerase III subunit gamma/tau [Pseudomonadota bacterium]|nr:DNA polymerase III subunit gamma/tau [Pseudomonadota bacterium]
MAYQVLARQWRPRQFSEIVGQAHVLRTLSNALTHNRLHHAYLFTGTRGVGKTTLARLLAKALSCETGISAQPCGHCNTCQEIDDGRFIDLLEVDAASRTKVEDTRELLDNVQYAPTQGRYKIYLIDEVHMLSTHSFNALLKTLEEPPAHVKFLLATTDPQKLPPTILSRCLQFNLKRLPLEAISEHLHKIITHEQLSAEPHALRLLAQAADGSVRDALSLLDQAIAYSGGQLTVAHISTMLGSLTQTTVIELIQLLAHNDAAGLLAATAQLADYHPDYMQILADILSVLQQLALAQIIPQSLDDHQDKEAMLSLAQQLAPEDVQLFYQIALLGRRDLPLAVDKRGGFEMILLRMLTFRPEIETETRSSEQTQPTPPERQALKPPTTPQTTATDEWAQVVHDLPLTGLLKQLALHCALKHHQGNEWQLVLPDDHKTLLSPKRQEELEQYLQQHYGENQRLRICVAYPETDSPAVQQQRIRETRQQAAVIAINHDPFVSFLKKHCEAEVKQVTAVKSDFN